jgi:hypothetical protein
LQLTKPKLKAIAIIKEIVFIEIALYFKLNT